MNETLKDIHKMMARIYIFYDGLSKDAYDFPWFCTMAERYGFIDKDIEYCFKLWENDCH